MARPMLLDAFDSSFQNGKDHAPQNEVLSCVMQPNPQDDRNFSIKSAMPYGTSMVHGLGC